jgi:hypothetical protein
MCRLRTAGLKTGAANWLRPFSVLGTSRVGRRVADLEPIQADCAGLRLYRAGDLQSEPAWGRRAIEEEYIRSRSEPRKALHTPSTLPPLRFQRGRQEMRGVTVDQVLGLGKLAIAPTPKLSTNWREDASPTHGWIGYTLACQKRLLNSRPAA